MAIRHVVTGGIGFSDGAKFDLTQGFGPFDSSSARHDPIPAICRRRRNRRRCYGVPTVTFLTLLLLVLL